jgi:hypothetical protein
VTIYISRRDYKRYYGDNVTAEFIVDAQNEDEAKEAFEILWGKGVGYEMAKGSRLFNRIKSNEIIRIDRETGCLIIPDAYGPAEDGWVGKLNGYQHEEEE